MRLFQVLMEASYDTMVTVIKAAHPDQAANIDAQVKWAKTVLVKSDRITWYLRIIQAWLSGDAVKLKALLGTYAFDSKAGWSAISGLGNAVVHFLGYDYVKIQNYAFVKQPVSEIISDLTALQKEWEAKNATKQIPVKTSEGDHVLFDFGGGLEWWFVDRGFCPEESRSGNHCGNVVGKHKTDQRILSLRKNGHVLMTFILEPDGTLGEMKAKGNQKPAEKYHPQIIKLLMWDRVTGITGEGYLPDSNFSVFDLNEQYLGYVDQHKPKLITDQLKITPIELIHAPDPIKLKYAQAVSPRIRKLVQDPSNENWRKAVADDPEMIVYAPTTMPGHLNKLVEFFDPDSDMYTGEDGEDGIEYIDEPMTMWLKCTTAVTKDPKYVKAVALVQPEILEAVLPGVLSRADTVELIKKNPHVISFLDPDQLDQKLVAVAVTSGTSPNFIPDQFKTRDMYLAFVSYNPDLDQVPEQFRDSQLCETAVKRFIFLNSMRAQMVQNRRPPIAYVPRETQTKEMCEAIVRIMPRALSYVAPQLRTREMCMMAITAQSKGESAQDVLSFVPEELMDLTMCETAVKHNPLDLRFVPHQFKTEQVCVTALTSVTYAIYLYNVVKMLPPAIADDVMANYHNSAVARSRGW